MYAGHHLSRNATLVATVNPPALAGGVFNAEDVDARHLPVFALPAGYPREKNFFHDWPKDTRHS